MAMMRHDICHGARNFLVPEVNCFTEGSRNPRGGNSKRLSGFLPMAGKSQQALTHKSALLPDFFIQLIQAVTLNHPLQLPFKVSHIRHLLFRQECRPSAPILLVALFGVRHPVAGM